MGCALFLIAIYLYTKFDLNANSSFKVICRTRYPTDGQSGDYMLPPLGSMNIINEILQHNKSAKLTQNTPIGNNNIFSRTLQLIEFLSCFSTIMSTLHDGSLVRQKLDNSRVVIQECQFTWLPILGEILCL